MSRNERRRVMLDIETVGLEVGAAIVEIGAVQFAPRGLIGETFYSSVSLTSSQEAGLTVDADTVEWWVGEHPEVAGEVLVGGDPLYESLVDFVAWYEEIDPHEVWANSPSFDCEMLDHAGEKVGVPMPWDFYQERDVRTLDSLPHDVDLEQEGTEHNALDDALYQARVASKILSELSRRDGHEPGGGDG
jgi:DNA polymerase III epsilon subunit-like protein